MKRDQFISLFFIVLLVFVVVQVFLILSPFFKAIFWSAILAFAFHPFYTWLRKRLPNATVASLAMTILIFLLVIPPVVFLLLNLIQQTIELYQVASDYVRQGGIERLIEHLRTTQPFISIQEKIVSWEPLTQQASGWLLNTVKSMGNYAAGQTANITKNILVILLNIAFMAFFIFVFLRDGEKIYSYIYQIAPLEEKSKKQIAVRINESFSAVIRGQLVTALTQAVLAGFIFWILGIPVPLLFATLTFFASIIPVVGAGSIWVPWVIYFFASHQTAKAVTLLIFGGLVISLADNVLKPALIGEKTKLPYFLLFFGILGGLKIYGLMGVFLAPVILTLFFTMVKIYQEN